MLPLNHLLEFVGIAAVIIAIPGPSVLFTVSRALTAGRRTALLTVVGNEAGLLLQSAAVAFGIGALVERSAQVFTVIKLAGAAYLVFLGVQAIRHRRALAEAVAGNTAPVRPLRALGDGLMVGMMNPKTIVFFVAVLPQFISRDAGHLPLQMLLLGAVFSALALVMDSVWAFGAGTAGQWLARSPRRMAAIGGTGGVAMIGIGVSLAAPGRKNRRRLFFANTRISTGGSHNKQIDKEFAMIAGKTILVTGANRGIGRALVEEALTRGAARVYAGTRQLWTHPDERVSPLILDVTDSAQIERAAGQVRELDVLINNAGISRYEDLSERSALEQHLAVNLYGTYEVTRAFLPQLTESKGAVVNNVSLVAFAPLPIIPAYSISKAAAFSLTQSMRALLARQNVTVQAVLTGPTDTDMNKGFDIPKATTAEVARAIFDGVDSGEEDIFPDPLSQSMAEGWRGSAAKAMERENAAFVA